MMQRQHKIFAGNIGFTLLEMLVVLAIIALVMTVSVAQLTTRERPLDTKRLALELTAFARAAQTDAIRQGRETTMSIDLASRKFWVETIKPARHIPDDVQISMTSARSDRPIHGRGDITFFPDGSASGANITVSHGTVQYRIFIDWLTGATSLEPIKP